MFKRNFIGASIGAILAGVESLFTGFRYQTMRPVTNKNTGRDWLRSGNGKYSPHQGARQTARYARRFKNHPISATLPTDSPGKGFARAERRRQARAERKAEKRQRSTSAKAARQRWQNRGAS